MLERKRVFILGAPGFPRGSAGANYDQYLALALLEAGWKVVILGKGSNRLEDLVDGCYIYKEIEYKNEKPTKLETYGLVKNFYIKMYHEYDMSKSDYFILHDIGWRAQKWLSKKVGVAHMSYIHYEDLLPIQYRHHLVNPRYWGMMLKWNFKLNRVPKAFPISTKLLEVEKKHGCKSMLLLPIMADPEEFGASAREQKPDVIKLIYSGAKANTHEDDLVVLFSALQKLSKEERERFELHITGMTKEKLIRKINNEQLLSGISLIVHGWMEYSELIDLYRSIDFLVLPRFCNAVTEANFPSKIPESLSFGIVPICSKVGDYTRYYLQDGYDSILFGTGDIGGCAEAIRTAIHMDESDYIKMRNNARKTAVEKFGYKVWAEKISEFLRS